MRVTLRRTCPNIGLVGVFIAWSACWPWIQWLLGASRMASRCSYTASGCERMRRRETMNSPLKKPTQPSGGQKRP